MKGAIGNALIMNIVITFVILFFTLLIGSMAYSKAYKTKNYLMTLIDDEERAGNHDFYEYNKVDEWDEKADAFLGEIGYPISNKKRGTCSAKDYYNAVIVNKAGRYDYCIYKRTIIYSIFGDPIIKTRYDYLVVVYMKFDLPLVGGLIRIPVTGETKAYSIYR
jgi:hypothetical protein